MTIYLPDTNILVDALNHKRGRRELLRKLVLEGNRLACCDVTVAEVYSGMWPHEAPRTDSFVSSLVWYESSLSIARRAGRLRFEYARKGMTLSVSDTLIAATALEHGLTLITQTRKHFPMPELSLHPMPGEIA
ncbi:MAG: type II toxin-antitoxin system VapC family toxin [Acidobacteriia bacterium]|nr:type II toxin-antitoxin system VapC family toxin [Terriglobia bacterium]